MGDKQVFISYSWTDRDVALRIKDAIPPSYNIWIDDSKISPGDEISRKIAEGLTGSDYYLLVISEDSTKSDWVKREIAYAFELSRRKKLALVPFLLKDVPVPLEFQGLLYIDATKSLDAGVNRVAEFFRQQETKLSELDPGVSAGPVGDPGAPCKTRLGAMTNSNLRYLISDRLTIEEVEVIWFDMFGRRMADETNVRTLSLSCIELIDRCRRERSLPELVDILCRNHPTLSR